MDFGLMLNCAAGENDLLESRVLASLDERGVYLSPDDIARIAKCRQSLLAQTERVEFDATGLNVLVEELAAAPCCRRHSFVATVEEALEAFYELREKLPAEVADDEIACEVAAAFAGAEGCVDCVDVDDVLAELVAMSDGDVREESEAGEYCIEDADGTVYRFDEAQWLYDEHCVGWDGERWEADYE